MQYNFNEIIDRRHTDSIKWDHIPGKSQRHPHVDCRHGFPLPPAGD